MSSAPEYASAQTERPSLASTIGKLSAIMASDSFPTGERAALKRLAVNDSLPIVFFRFWIARVGEELPPERHMADWGVILWGLAFTRGRHESKAGFGAALAGARYSEARLERLLSAPEDTTRRVLLSRAVRFLAAKGVLFDWTAPAAWLLASDQTRDATARRIARDYYTAMFRLQSNNRD